MSPLFSRRADRPADGAGDPPEEVEPDPAATAPPGPGRVPSPDVEAERPAAEAGATATEEPEKRKKREEGEAVRAQKARDDAIQAALAAIALRIEALSGTSSSFRDLVAEKLVDRAVPGPGPLVRRDLGLAPGARPGPELDRGSDSPGSGSPSWPEPVPPGEVAQGSPAAGDLADYTEGEVTERRLSEVQRGLLGVQGGLRELAHASDSMGRTLRGLADGSIKVAPSEAVEQRTDELGRRLLRRLDGVEQSLAAAVRDEQAWLRAGMPPELAAKAQTAILASLEPLETALHQRLDDFVDKVVSGVAQGLKETEDAVVQRLQEEMRAEQRAMSRRLETRLDAITREMAGQGGQGRRLEEVIEVLEDQASDRDGLGERLDALGREIGALVKSDNATALQLLDGRLEERLDALEDELQETKKSDAATSLKLTGIRERLADACSALDRLGARADMGPPEPVPEVAPELAAELAEMAEVNQLVAERLEELTREMQTVRRRLPVRGPALPLVYASPDPHDEDEEYLEDAAEVEERDPEVLEVADVPEVPAAPEPPRRRVGSRGPRRTTSQGPRVKRAGELGPPAGPWRRPIT